MHVQLNFVAPPAFRDRLVNHCKATNQSQAAFIRQACTQAMGSGSADTPATINAQIQDLLARQAALLAAPFHL